MAEDELGLSDEHITEAEERITQQLALIDTLAAQGRDTAAAKELLREVERHLEILHEHRRAILDKPGGVR